MAYDKTQEFDFTPNSDVPFEIATSFNDNLLDESAGEAGYGSFLNRSVASDLLYYYSHKFPFDQFSQLFGSMVDTPHGKWEWFQADALLDFEAEGVTENATDVINNTDGGNTYVPDSENVRFVIDTDDKGIFKVYDVIRYEISTGWEFAIIVGIDDAAVETELQLESIDGEDLAVAASNDALIQRISSNLPQDLDYDPAPRQSNPKGYETYTENFRREIQMTRKFDDINANGGTLIDLVEHHQRQLTENFRRDRETATLLGKGARTIKDTGTDKIQFSNGIYYQTRDRNLHTSDLKTGGVFDADKFKTFVNNFMLFNFGGESGGPPLRDFYVDPLMQSYFDQAWEDRQRFMTTEYIAGVKVNRFDNNQGAIDITKIPQWSQMHPLRDAAVRGGSDLKAVGLLLPMDEEHVTRVLQTGFGPRQEVFKLKGGDRIFYQRLESIEGLAIRLPEHTAVFEEVDE